MSAGEVLKTVEGITFDAIRESVGVLAMAGGEGPDFNAFLEWEAETGFNSTLQEAA